MSTSAVRRSWSLDRTKPDLASAGLHSVEYISPAFLILVTASLLPLFTVQIHSGSGTYTKKVNFWMWITESYKSGG